MEWISGNVVIRPQEPMAVGDVIPSHQHNFDHTTILFSGAVRAIKRMEGETVIVRDYHAPHHFLIRAEEEHEFVALADNTILWCVYSHRWPQSGEAVKNSGWEAEIYEQLNQLCDDVIEQPMGFSGAYT